MLNNQPITGVSTPIPANDFLISKTDLAGMITYANRTFCKVSGFSEIELLGQPHNIARHPDMPATAFADLWQTIQNGAEWSGLIKNRCKNGNYYWVHATVMPEQDEQGATIGYISVRRAPSTMSISDEACEATLLSNDDGNDTVSLEEGNL